MTKTDITKENVLVLLDKTVEKIKKTSVRSEMNWDKFEDFDKAQLVLMIQRMNDIINIMNQILVMHEGSKHVR
ncbi:MAG TPA: hypothetical protein VMX17_12715 [Candidatus Glassbacteria bacterium]|nr:hypothetical protein [Candidatus Glassbacteria bacterium]